MPVLLASLTFPWWESAPSLQEQGWYNAWGPSCVMLPIRLYYVLFLIHSSRAPTCASSSILFSASLTESCSPPACSPLRRHWLWPELKPIRASNYGSVFTHGSAITQTDYENHFPRAQQLVGTSGFTSARLFTRIQAGNTKTPTQAIPAAFSYLPIRPCSTVS